MILIFIASIVAILSFNTFLVAYQINGINRAIIFTPISLIEASSSVDTDKNIPYINQELLMNSLTHYYDCEIGRYTKDYAVYYYFYNNDKVSYCVQNNCSFVEVEIDAQLMNSYHYHRVMYYGVNKN